jgi:hypothetical protein
LFAYRAQRAPETEAKQQDNATSQKSRQPAPIVSAKPRRDQQGEAAKPRPVAKSKAASQAPAARQPRFRNCSGIDGTFQVPACRKCPLSGYAHY